MRKLFYAVLVLSTLLLSAWNTSPHRTYSLEVDNKSAEPVSLKLDSPARSYYLFIPAGEAREYKVVGGVYDHVTNFCNIAEDGELQMGKSLKLVFTDCKNPALNRGEGGHAEKVFPDFENKLNWVYSR